MSVDNSNNSGGGRRGSITQSTFGALFNRSNSISAGTPATPSAPQSINPSSAPPRRMSITTLGLNGGGPSPMQASTPFFINRDRRNSISTADSNSVDESAIEDDEPSGISQSVPSTPFARRMSVGAGAFFSSRGGNSPGASGDGLNWSEQFRSRAESAVGHNGRPSFGASGSANATSKPMAINPQGTHERARSVSDMSDPPQQMPERPQEVRGKKTPKWATGGAKPDEVGERILRGEFLMD